MIEIKVIEPGYKVWNDTIKFAKGCSWRAGIYLAKKMEDNDFEENERVLVAMYDGNIAGFCTYANKDELPSEYEFTPFVGFMFVDEIYSCPCLTDKQLDEFFLTKLDATPI